MSASQQGENSELAKLVGEWMLNPSKRHPKSTSIIKAITSEPQPLPPEELPEEFTAEDYDEWVYQALLDLVGSPQRFHACPENKALIECPKKRFFRIGDEAQREGKPSELYRQVMELTDGGATLPAVTDRAMRKAQKYLRTYPSRPIVRQVMMPHAR